jgi:hypothetical protein
MSLHAEAAFGQLCPLFRIIYNLDAEIFNDKYCSRRLT